MKQNNRGWIEWREPEVSPNFAGVSPKVFREMKQQYEDEGKSVSVLGDKFYGAILVVDNVQIAKRIKPEVWETSEALHTTEECDEKSTSFKSFLGTFDWWEYIIWLIFVCIASPIVTLFICFVAAITGACFFNIQSSWNEEPWYAFILNFWWLWDIVHVIIYTLIYRLKYTNIQKYNEINYFLIELTDKFLSFLNIKK